MPHFFFSYARDDAHDDLLYRFFDELSVEVGALLGRTGDIGFLDRNQQSGADWAATTGEALGTCDVFVPVYSSHYFTSEYCAQEWHAFQTRLEQHRGATGNRPLCVVPVWWIPPIAGVPESVSRTQDTRSRFGAEHEQHGLRYLMRVTSRRHAYEEALVGLAQCIVEAGRTPARPIGTIDLTLSPNAFRPLTLAPPGPPLQRPARSVRGPRTVHFVVVAAGAERMRLIRSVLESYGEDWSDWRPYHPETPFSLALRAQGVAVTQDMLSMLRPLDDTIQDVIKTARARSELVVLLLDPWATGLEDYHRILADLDDRRYVNTAVVVPWEASADDAGAASAMLYACLPNLSADEQWFHDDIHSLKEFEAALAKVLGEVRRRVVKQATKVRRVSEPGPSALPVVAGPGGMTP